MRVRLIKHIFNASHVIFYYCLHTLQLEQNFVVQLRSFCKERLNTYWYKYLVSQHTVRILNLS